MKLALPDMISNSYFPAMAAAELGFFAKEGLDVSLELMSPADKAYRALRRGRGRFRRCRSPCRARGLPAMAGHEAGLRAGPGHVLVPGDARRPRRPPRRPASVRGRRIGAAPFVELGLRRLLMEEGIDPDRDVAIAPIPGSLGLKVNTGVTAAQALADKRDRRLLG